MNYDFFATIVIRYEEYTIPSDVINGGEYTSKIANSFWQDVWKIVCDSLEVLQPSVKEAAVICAGILAMILLLSITSNMSYGSNTTLHLVGCIAIGTLLFQSTESFVKLSVSTICELSDFSKIITPVLASAMAAQGATASSSSLYIGATVLNSILSNIISNLLSPMVYVFLCLSIANCATCESMLLNLRNFVKWAMVWGLKITLYVFTGFMGLSGVISGATDAATLKATKLTISGMVPVVGGILSDASESVLVSAGLVKNAVGLNGLIVILAIWLEPFIKIGVQYLLLKSTSAICAMFGPKPVVDLLKSFTTAMGILLAMTGAVSLMLMVSVICFMKGVS